MTTQEEEKPSCVDCERKRLACEERAHRWIATLMQTDDELRQVLAFLDYHRSRSEKRAFIEALRKKLLWVLMNMK